MQPLPSHTRVPLPLALPLVPQGNAVGTPVSPGLDKPLSVVEWTGAAWQAVGSFGGAGTGSMYNSLAFNPVNGVVSGGQRCSKLQGGGRAGWMPDRVQRRCAHVQAA